MDQKQNSKPGNLYARSQSVECQILEIDHEKRRLSLGIKQLTPNPWNKFNEANPLGSIIETEINSIKENIIFCSLDEEIDGAIFIDLINKTLTFPKGVLICIKSQFKKYQEHFISYFM